MLGVPRLFGGHSLSQDMGFLLLPQLGPGTEQTLAAGRCCAPGARHCTALQVAERKSLSHTGDRRVSAGGDGGKDHAQKDDPESPGMRPCHPYPCVKLTETCSMPARAWMLPLEAVCHRWHSLESMLGTNPHHSEHCRVPMAKPVRGGAALSSPQGQFTAEPTSRSQGLFHPLGCFIGLSSPHRSFLPWRVAGVSMPGHVSLELQ